MIPSAEELAAGWSFVARRRGLPDTADLEALVRVVQIAEDCAGDDRRAEPAALFFALAQEPRAFERGWRVSCEVLPAAHAHGLGLTIGADAIQLADLRLAVFAGRMSCENVKQWFAARLEPR